jgi:hypothetical protein
MKIEFIVDDAACCLEVRIDGKVEFLVTPALLWADERDGVLRYLRRVAEQLNELHSAGRMDQVVALLARADRHMHRSRCAD